MWYDNWHALGPLCYVLSSSEIRCAGFNLKDKVSLHLSNPLWCWPEDWVELIPQLLDHQDVVLNHHVPQNILEMYSRELFASVTYIRKPFSKFIHIIRKFSGIFIC